MSRLFTIRLNHHFRVKKGFRIKGPGRTHITGAQITLVRLLKLLGIKADHPAVRFK